MIGGTFRQGFQLSILPIHFIRQIQITVTYVSVFLHYANLSKALEVICSGKVHRCGCQLFRFGRILQYVDHNCEIIIIGAVLTLQKDVFWCSYPQHIWGRHHLPAERWDGTTIENVDSVQKEPHYC